MDIVLWLIAAATAVPCAVLLFECIAGVSAPTRSNDAEPIPTFAVVIPAHDESAGIEATLRALLHDMPVEGSIAVIADNCTDDTADLARGTGVTVFERRDDARRGKGFAISFGVEQLRAAPPEVIIVVDADCGISQGGLTTLARRAAALNRPVQAEYTMSAAGGDRRSAISALAFIVRNVTRPRGLARAGFPVHLTGSGMAFPWKLIDEAPSMEGWIVEDLLLGIELALAGSPTALASDVQVSSSLPAGERAARAQRTRWEHGQLATMIRRAPTLVFSGLIRASPGLVALGLDLAVPPLALLVVALGFATLVATVLAWGQFATWGPAMMFASNVAVVAVAIIAAWFAHGRATVRARDLIGIPLAVLWKIPLYLSFAVRGRQRTWERTDRENDVGE